MTDTPTGNRIDAAHRAAHYPDDCSLESIGAALEGRALHSRDLLQEVDPVCGRCRRMNEKREMAGVDPVDAQLKDGDSVTAHAIHMAEDDDGLREAHWHLTRCNHEHHEQLAFEDVVQAGTALVRVRAKIHEAPDGRLHLVDVTAVNASPRPNGPQQSTVEKRQQKHVDDSDAPPGEALVIDRHPEEPPADWPAEAREWLAELVAEHGPLQKVTPGPSGFDRV